MAPVSAISPGEPPADVQTHPVDWGLRKPPHSLEAEQGVLGAILQWPVDALPVVSEVVVLADFYGQPHRSIYAAMLELSAAGLPVDIIAVFERLQQHGQDEEVGGLAYLNALCGCVATARNARRHAEIVAERAALRALIAATDEIATAAFSPNGRAASVLFDEARTQLAQIQEARSLGVARRLPVLTGPELVAAAEAANWLVEGVLPEQAMGMLYGGSGTFKSFVALDMALHVVHGLPFMGRPTEKGPALWLAAEGGTSFGHRVNAWHRARRLPVSKDLIGIPVAVDLGNEAWRVVDAVQSTVAITPRVVVIDTLSQTYTAGAEENSATHMAAYLREIGTRLRDLWKATVIIVHHSGHSATERPRGSSAIQANTAFLFGCWRDEKEMLCTLSCQHMKDGERFDDATFSLRKVELGEDKYGRPLSHLAAHHLSSAEEVQEAADAEVQAGRGGKNQLLLSLMQNGQRENDLRKAFYQDCRLDNEEARRKAYYRSRAWAMKAGLLEIAEGYVLALKPGKK